MTCNEVRKFLDAYVDDELDLVHNLEIERHLQDCVGCQNTYQNYLTIRKNLKGRTGVPGAARESLYFQMPDTLPKRIHTSLQNTTSRPARSKAVSTGQMGSGMRIGRGLVWGFSIAGILVLLAVAGIIFMLNFSSSPQTGEIAAEVLDSHIRSLMVDHLADVASTDQHTVKPWFDGKLDFSPVVEDFATQGYPLIGGRLEYINKQPGAALVYNRGKHVINVFIWRNNNSGQNTDVQANTGQGYYLLHWSRGGFDYWVVSDLNESDLGAFVNILKPVISP